MKKLKVIAIVILVIIAAGAAGFFIIVPEKVEKSKNIVLEHPPYEIS